MDQAKLVAWLKPFTRLSGEQLDLISIYIDLLLKWNARINLTALRTPEQIVGRHFGESFFAAESLISPSWLGTVSDVGSGAGFPGIPFAIYSPIARVRLIESNQKKAAFLNEAISALRLGNVTLSRSRVEAMSGTSDLVTMRAVERFATVVQQAERLVVSGGRLALLIGSSQVELAKRLLSHLSWSPPVEIPSSESRVLLTGQKPELNN